MSQLVTINLSKQPGASWGFRLQGGKDFAQPLGIQKVTVGSVAEQAGVRVGDSIVSIGGSDALSMRHKEAQDAIVKAGNSFQLVVQRGSSLWKPKVTPLAQPARTPQGPVATQTSLAKSQATKIKHFGSSHNTSPRPFPGPGTWATSPVLPQPSSPIHSLPPRGPTESTPQSAFSRSYLYTEENRTDSQSFSRSRVSMKDEISFDGRSEMSSSEQLLDQSGRDSVDGSYGQTYESTNHLSRSTTSSWRSPRNPSPRLTSSHDNLNDIHHASFITDSERGRNRSTSPPFPPPPPPLQSARSDSSTGVMSPMRSPSPGGGNLQGHNSSFSNRSPSPYNANCFSSRTPRSLSPSCSIPSMPSTGSLANIGVVGSPPKTSSMTASNRSQILDPVSDIEKDGSLKIEGADIALDKENARNFLQMQLDKERARELYVKSLSSDNSHMNGEKDANGLTKGRKFSHGSPLKNRSNSVAVDNALINAGIKNYFANKSSENIYMKSNSVDRIGSEGRDSAAPWSVRKGSKVSDSIKLFDGGRRHSSFTPPQYGGRLNFKSHTLDRATRVTTPPPTPSGSGRYNKQGGDTSKRAPNRWEGGEGPLRKTPFSGSCSSLSYTSDEKFGGTNCNVPWRNHFSELRRRSVSAMSAGTPRGYGTASEPGSGTRVRDMAWHY